jgi:hypothetical protein
MELLLWMWLYDPRWFFNFKISVRFYKYIWFIPLTIHMLIVILGSLELMKEPLHNNEISTLQIWLCCRIFFSFLISLIISIFMIKISRIHKKESSFFENAKKVFPHLNDVNNDYEYWIKRNSLISTPGIFLLILGFISLFWSYLIIEMIYVEKIFIEQGLLKQMLLFNCLFIFIGNVPLFLVLLVFITVKITSFLSAFMCPTLLIWNSKMINKV